MAELVGEYALHFVGAVGGLDQAAKDIDVLTARHERVDAAIAEQVDAHLSGTQPRRDEQRIDHVLEQRLGFGVAQHRLRHHRPRGNRHHGDERQQQAQRGAPGARPGQDVGRGWRDHRRPSCAARLNLD